MTEEGGGGASLTTEPAAGSSTGTDVALLRHLSVIVEALDRRSAELRAADIRFDEERNLRYQEQRQADEKLAEARRAADQKAIELQREVDQEHFAHLNEAAARSIEERAHFATRELVESLKESLGVFKEEINQRLDTRSGERQGVTGSARVLVGVLSAVVALLAIFAFWTSNQTADPVVVNPVVTVPAK